MIKNVRHKQKIGVFQENFDKSSLLVFLQSLRHVQKVRNFFQPNVACHLTHVGANQMSQFISLTTKTDFVSCQTI